LMSNSFKLFFQEEIRRTTLPSSARWAVFLNQVQSILGSRFSLDLVFEYRDEEGDLIRINSEMEWRECLQVLLGEKVKKIIAKTPVTAPPSAPCQKKKCGSFKKCHRERKDKPKCCPQQNENPFNSLLKDLPNMLPFLLSQFSNFCPSSPAAATTTSSSSSSSSSSNACPFSMLSELMNNLQLSDLLTQIQKGVSVQHLMKITQYFHDIALSLFEEKRFEEAKFILEILCQVDPKNIYFTYNLACAVSLLNRDLSRAVQLLRQAISNGYTNFTHIDKDSDLNNLRSHPEFMALMTSLRPPKEKEAPPPCCQFDKAPAQPVEKEQPVQDPPQQEQEQEQQQQQPEQQKQPEIFADERELLKQMGFLDDDMNLALLTAENGDVNGVITALLRPKRVSFRV